MHISAQIKQALLLLCVQGLKQAAAEGTALCQHPVEAAVSENTAEPL